MGTGTQPNRKRCKRWDGPWQAHYLTFSCFRRQPFLAGRNSPTWLLQAIDQARLKTPFDLWAFVIMPEHVHLLLMPADGVRISSILYQIKKPVITWALAWTRRTAPGFPVRMEDLQPGGRRSYRFWQRGGGYDRNLRSVRDIHEKLRYIHNNPLRRGLAAQAQDWPWSSYAAWGSGEDRPIRIDRATLPTLELL